MGARITVDAVLPEYGAETNLAVAEAAGMCWGGDPDSDGALWAKLPSVGGMFSFDPSRNAGDAFEAMGLCGAGFWTIDFERDKDDVCASVVGITINAIHTQWAHDDFMERPSLAICGAIIAWARDAGRLPKAAPVEGVR